MKPRADLKPNTAAFENEPLVTPNGFREYDARWLFGKELNLLGVQALGLGLGTYLHEIGIRPTIIRQARTCTGRPDVSTVVRNGSCLAPVTGTSGVRLTSNSSSLSCCQPSSRSRWSK